MTVYQTGPAFHGGGEYSYTVLYSLLDRIEREGLDINTHIFTGGRDRRDEKILSALEKRGVKIHVCSGPEDLGQLVIDEKIDLIYSALPRVYYFRGLKIPPHVKLIITIHGLRRTELKEEGLYLRFERLRMIRKDMREAILERVDRDSFKKLLYKEYRHLLDITDNYTLVTGSWHSYYNIIRHFPECRDHIKMLGCPGKTDRKIDNPEREAAILKEFGVEHDNFGMFISMDRYEKNPVRNMAAFDLLFEEAGEILPKGFKCLGLGAKDPDKYLKNVRNKERFIIRGYVKDDELETLYKHAHVVLFTSLNEGFGYPPMEAMKYGTMVVASVNTSIPEVCGDAAFMCNPLMPTEIANRIMQSFEPTLIEEKKELIPLQYKKITEGQAKALDLIVDEIVS